MKQEMHIAGWWILSCFLFFIACSGSQQKMLQKKWHLNAVSVSHADEGSLMDSDSTAHQAGGNDKMITDTVHTEGSTDFFDFSDSKNYTAQLMGSATNGSYVYNETTKRITRHNETTNITDTLEVKKLVPDTLILFEKENNLTLFLVANK